MLKDADICIADDGLKDTPGWKIGEYVLFKKAIISTPISVFIEGFNEGSNYLSTSSRIDYQILPDLVASLQKKKRYLDLGINNSKWSDEYLDPLSYMTRIVEILS